MAGGGDGPPLRTAQASAGRRSRFVIYYGEVSEDSDGPVEVCVPVAAVEPADGGHAARAGAPRGVLRITKAQVEYPQILSAFDAVSQWLPRRPVDARAAPRGLLRRLPGGRPERRGVRHRVPGVVAVQLVPIGVVRSTLRTLADAPGRERRARRTRGWRWTPRSPTLLHGIEVGDELIVITWLHEARRGVFKARPRSDPAQPADRRVRDAFAGPAQSARPPPACPRDQRQPAARRADRGDRRNAGRRHQAGAVLISAGSAVPMIER